MQSNVLQLLQVVHTQRTALAMLLVFLLAHDAGKLADLLDYMHIPAIRIIVLDCLLLKSAKLWRTSRVLK
jgi:hypothetical protein